MLSSSFLPIVLSLAPRESRCASVTLPVRSECFLLSAHGPAPQHPARVELSAPEPARDRRAIWLAADPLPPGNPAADVCSTTAHEPISTVTRPFGHRANRF